MHFFHPTPLDIVEQYIASKIKGKHFSNVLDPCVGDGALLTSLKNNFDTVTIIDIDSDRLKKFNSNVFTKYCDDFLCLEFDDKFDLILCNPPFNNKSISGPSIEEMFLIKCLNLLKPDGSGIFILPSSIINGTKSKKLREYLVKNYTIASIEILPKKTFTKIESHFYILLLKNVKSNSNYYFETNIDYINTESILKDDYSTLNPLKLLNIIKYDNLLKNFKTFDLSNNSLFRGNTEKKFSQLHTTNFSSFFCKNFSNANQIIDGKNIKKYDLLCKRVGRNCHNSFALFLNKNQATISDCIIAIPLNPKKPNNSIILLINIRLSILLGASYSFLIDGSGANYISISKLKNTKFIDFRTHLSKKDLKKFSYLLLKKDIKKLSTFELSLKNKILERVL